MKLPCAGRGYLPLLLVLLGACYTTSFTRFDSRANFLRPCCCSSWDQWELKRSYEDFIVLEDRAIEHLSNSAAVIPTTVKVGPTVAEILAAEGFLLEELHSMQYELMEALNRSNDGDSLLLHFNRTLSKPERTQVHKV